MSSKLPQPTLCEGNERFLGVRTSPALHRLSKTLLDLAGPVNSDSSIAEEADGW